MMQIPAARIHFAEEDRRELVRRFDEILESGQLTLGKYGREFESEFARCAGTEYAVAVSSGTSALEIILRALDIEGWSVVVPTNTFFATAASVVHAGGRVIFADVGDNLCLDAEALRRAIAPDTRAVIVVHIGGAIPPQIAEIEEICRERGLFLVEDAAHAHGSTLDGRRAGALGKAAAFSFYPTKVLTSAEGGMITTDDEGLYQRATVFRDQGKAGFHGNVHVEMGYNWRMSELHAAVGLAQLARLEGAIAERRRIARIYDQGLGEIEGVTSLALPAEVGSNYYKYVAFLADGIDRASLKGRLKEGYGVSLSGEVYELPCHLQPIFKGRCHMGDGGLARAEDLCRRHICLPVFVGMTEEQAGYVLDSLKEVL